MKLMTLNIWGGHVFQALVTFIKLHQDIDIFCFQEVYHNAPSRISIEDRSVNLKIFSELQELLPEHTGYFRPVVNNIYGIAIFVRKSIKVLGEGDFMIHNNPNYAGRGPTHSRNLQWLECVINEQPCLILNVHGLWNGQGKSDSLERLEQSMRIKTFIDAKPLPRILCGDFNLRPDTQSMSIIEKGMTNLIKTYKVLSTRTSLYSKDEKFADYVLTSPEIIVHQFDVLSDEVSDHAPLLVDFVIDGI